MKRCDKNDIPDKIKGCFFQPEQFLGHCGKIDSQAALGYDDGTPCIILKLNKMYGWLPKPIICPPPVITNQNVTEQKDCDGLTRSEMEWFQTVGRPGVPLHDLFNGYHIPVTCQGQHDPDQENLHTIHWEPREFHGSFPTFFYPYLNQRGYLAPLVAAKFNVSRAVLLMIRCRAWAKNVHNIDVASREGAVHFELMVD